MTWNAKLILQRRRSYCGTPQLFGANGSVAPRPLSHENLQLGKTRAGEIYSTKNHRYRSSVVESAACVLFPRARKFC